jgi:hypothetical protein
MARTGFYDKTQDAAAFNEMLQTMYTTNPADEASTRYFWVLGNSAL